MCRYAAEAIARQTDWEVTLLSLHDPPGEFKERDSGLRIVCLGLDGNCARLFLEWLQRNPQDVVITSDVSRIEDAYPFLPQPTCHVVQIHDSGRRYRAVATRHARWIDGVTCVANHIELLLRKSLTEVGFYGLLRTVHNGAKFPPIKPRTTKPHALRLLYMGRVDALKGVFDFVPLLTRLQRLAVPVSLNIVGGDNEALRRQFARHGVERLVTWTGRVPHEHCYEIAAESDLLLMPTRKESFGMVTIEAMSMGCVPMAYDIRSGSTEIIEHRRSGLLLRLGNIAEWAEAIRELHNDRDGLGALSSGAIARARGQFDANVMARNMAGLIEDVAANAAKHRVKREPGMPAPTPAHYAPSRQGYQRLPAVLREWIRNRVGRHPGLCYLWLNR